MQKLASKNKGILLTAMILAGILLLISMGVYFTVKEQFPDSTKRSDNRIISWEEAEKFFEDCQVTGAFQAHSGYRELYLKNGESVEIKREQLGSIFLEAQKNEGKCGHIILVSE